MRPPNVYNAPCEYLDSDPPGYRSGMARVGEAAGGKALAVKLYEIPPGESLCPYHYEYEEEWLLVLAGAVAVRGMQSEQQVDCGGIVCFPPGPAGAHKVTNRGETAARLMMFSSAREPAVAVYPDSDKIGVWPGRTEDELMVRRANGSVDYWDGEG